VAQLIADITGTTPSGRLVSEVHARTEGNPLFVRELVRLLASEGHLTGEGELADQMPARVRDVIRRRISRLPEATTALLVVAAVIGRDFSLPVLEEVSGLEGDRALALVEAALMSGIVVDSPEIVGGFRFSHVLVRQALCDQLSAVRRARLHARVARALESIYGTDDDAHVVELAHHLFQAAPVLGPERGFEYALRAAEMARSGFAYEQAVEQLGHALELLRATPSGLERVRRELDVQIRLGTVSTMAEGYAAARVARAWARARDLSQQAGDGRGYLRSLWGQQASVFVRADFGLVRQIAHQLLASAGGSAEREYLLAGHAAFGMADFHQGKLKAADEHLERAQALSDALAGRSLMDVFVFDPAVVTRAYRAMSWSLLGEQDGRSRELCSEALWVADRRGQPFTRVLARLLAACVARLLGDVPEVRRRLEQAMALADRWRFASYTAIGSICRGWILAHQDTATAGVAEMEAGLRALDRAGWRIMWPFFLSMLAEARWQAKQVDEALAAVERGLEEAETLGEHFYDAELWRLRGDLLLARWPEYGAEAARSLRRAVVVAEHQSAALHRRRAEASLTRLRSSEPPTGEQTGPDRIVAGVRPGPVA
jgi:predicted ATPase